MNIIIGKLEKFAITVEEKGTFLSWALYIASFIILRNGLESLISEGKVFSASLFFSQYPIFYLAVFLVASIWLGIFAPPAKRSYRIAALGFGFITLAPILDLLIIGHGIPLGYLQFNNFSDFVVSLVTFGANLPFYPADRGFSPGLRIELYIIYFCMFIYVFLRTKKLWRAILAPYLFHITLFIIASVSYINKLLVRALLNFSEIVFNGTRLISTASMLTFIVVILLAIWLIIIDKRIFAALTKGFRLVRFIHYGGMLIAGVWIGIAGDIDKLYALNYFDLLALYCGYAGIWFFAIFINFYFDFEGDKLVGQKNPLTSDILSKHKCREIAWASLVLGLIIIGSIRSAAFKMATLFAAAAYLYSAPPARLKRFPLLSTATLGIATLAGLLMGYSFARVNIDGFPSGIAWAAIISVTLGFCTKDIKDTEGDKATGVITIPVIFGEKIGRIVCAFLSFLALILVPIIAGGLTFLSIFAAIFFGMLSFLLIAFSHRFDERMPLLISSIYVTVYIIYWYPF